MAIKGQRFETSPRQKAYVQEWFMNGFNRVAAWRKAYDKHGATDGYAKYSAHRLHHSKNVHDEIKRRQAQIQRRNNVKVDDLINELEEARQLALVGTDSSRPSAAAAVSATMGKAKILGMDKQIIDHVSSDGTMSPGIIELVAKVDDETKG